MNHKQYSDLQRCIGVLEGVGYALEGQASLLFYGTLEALSSIIDKLRPEIGNEEGCTEEECSTEDTPPLGTVTHEEAVAMFRALQELPSASGWISVKTRLPETDCSQKAARWDR